MSPAIIVTHPTTGRAGVLVPHEVGRGEDFVGSIVVRDMQFGGGDAVYLDGETCEFDADEYLDEDIAAYLRANEFDPSRTFEIVSMGRDGYGCFYL